MRSTDVCQSSQLAGTRASLVPVSCRSFHFALPHRSQSLLRMTAPELRTCALRKTETVKLVRGMSVSRRSSRFGGHPDADDCCRFAGKRFLQSSSEDVVPLTFLSPAQVVPGCELSLVADRFDSDQVCCCRPLVKLSDFRRPKRLLSIRTQARSLDLRHQTISRLSRRDPTICVFSRSS
jgi:hypothetical protein